ncbi:hypothetical protein B0G81_7330 [Paraburkholderia sp. BL6665CI2N2]|uniref:hypothetical protein n=1 Tax=unclassified Paraburkholderia TaxID=2615204 RepID=UPI000D081749|nr:MULTISPECIES: hypothetical protein [unclassified Paraburkholderia]PRY01118.1 hypothetical protein B0G73_12078 [Paraburkholderia sp. BL25I1N1]TDY26802.1 hypothetical protein B0G81_7330 [Paraburkholderia sp. BL6665CI2N2]
MKSLIQAVAIAVVLAAPVASFAQSSNEPVSQGAQTQAAGHQDPAQAGNSGYGSASAGTWQAGQGSDTTVSSYSPPIHNAR